MVLEGEAAQMAKAVGKYVLGVGVESSDDRIFDPRTTVGRTATAVFRIIDPRKDKVGVATAVFRIIGCRKILA